MTGAQNLRPGEARCWVFLGIWVTYRDHLPLDIFGGWHLWTSPTSEHWNKIKNTMGRTFWRICSNFIFRSIDFLSENNPQVEVSAIWMNVLLLQITSSFQAAVYQQTTPSNLIVDCFGFTILWILLKFNKNAGFRLERRLTSRLFSFESIKSPFLPPSGLF